MDDIYRELAESYDLMHLKNPGREKFFQTLFSRYKTRDILDCACGTGRDLLMLQSMGFNVRGSDLSDAMLEQAKMKIRKQRLDIPLKKADFRNLGSHFKREFDAVICLSNSINEVLDDKDAIRALMSMKSVLRSGGILVVDQGQTDSSMKKPPKFAPIFNNRDMTRVFIMEYSKDIMDMNVVDFIHTERESTMKHSRVRVKIRLQDDWTRIFKKTDFNNITFYGGWDFEIYDKETSRRLIVVAET